MASQVTTMARKIYTFYEYGDADRAGEKLFECESRQGDEVLAQLYLFSKGNPVTAADFTAKAALEAFMSAEDAGHPVVELPANRRKITVESVLALLNTVKIDITVIDPEEEDEGGSDGAVVANPTDTQAVSS